MHARPAGVALICIALVAAAVLAAPVARADQSVTYTVDSDVVSTSNIEYFDGVTRHRLVDVPLPWTTTVSMANPGRKAMLRAVWRTDIPNTIWHPGDFVTVRLDVDGNPGCEVTLDTGSASCHGRLVPFGPGVLEGA